MGREMQITRKDILLEGGIQPAQDIQPDAETIRNFWKNDKVRRLHDVVPAVLRLGQ